MNDLPPLVLADGEYEVRPDQLRRQRPCVGCGAPLVWIVTEAGRRMPLAARTQRASRCPSCGPGFCARCGGTGRLHAVMNHWVDCPNPPARRARVDPDARSG